MITLQVDDTLIARHLDSLVLRSKDKRIYNNHYGDDYTNLEKCLEFLCVSFDIINCRNFFRYVISNLISDTFWYIII